MNVISDDEGDGEKEIAGISFRELFTHKPGEQFIYDGGVFTRLIFSHSLRMCFEKEPEVIKMMKTSNKMFGDYFLAVDQHGVVNIFSRNENVIAVSVYTPPVAELVDL